MKLNLSTIKTMKHEKKQLKLFDRGTMIKFIQSQSSVNVNLNADSDWQLLVAGQLTV